MKLALVRGRGLLVLGYGVGCGGSEPADTAQPADATQPADTAQATGPVLELGASSIAGSITFDGVAPNLPALSMDAEPECADKHTGPVPAEMLVLGDGNTMGNIIVWVSDGLPAGNWAAPTTPVVLDQNGCVYAPHAMGIMVGQPYRILNSDGMLHNIHTLPEINLTFNRAMPATLTETTTTFGEPEAIFQIKCDVHPWMLAYIGVFDHPFFSVTNADGTFSLEGLPPGTYEITAWHERLGTQTASITVGDSEAASQDFTFAVPAA